MAGEVQQTNLPTGTPLMSPLPERMTSSESEASLGLKFLEVCQELTSKGIPFTCTLSINSNLNLTLDTRGKEKREESTTSLARKKSSPSTMRRNARRKALYLEKKEGKRQCQEIPKAAEKTTAAAKTTLKELGDTESRRITTSMENQRTKGIPEVEHAPERLLQLDGDMEYENENNEGEDEEGISEDGSGLYKECRSRNIS